MRFTKIMPTLGPSSWDEATIEKLIEAGANAFRLNFSHADAARHIQTAQNVRAVATKLGRHIALLQDLQGPKIRIGKMQPDVVITNGQTFVLDSSEADGDATRAPLPHPEILQVLQVGDTVSLNDGVLRLQVTEKAQGRVTTIVEAGGPLSSRKGVNVPGRMLPISALTPKDIADIEVGKTIGVDYVALSFVQTANDITEARSRISPTARLMAKIETQAAVDNFDAILQAADAIMIARGDLGVELPTEAVPPLQRKMIAASRKAGKPVVVATQMLESMIANPVPTRAEASDVANAAYAGADALMLSAESASGQHPIEAVSVMRRIIENVEASELWLSRDSHATLNSCVPVTVSGTTCVAASELAELLGAKLLVSFTETGHSSRQLARTRCPIPQVGLTPHAHVARQLMLVWGTEGMVLQNPVHDPEEMVQAAHTQMMAAQKITKGERMVVVAGMPFGQAGTTNLIRVIEE